MTRIALVTDSSSDLTREIYQENGITVVPLTVHFGDESFIDTVEISSSEFFDKLKRSQVMPKTSQPSPADFVAVSSACSSRTISYSRCTYRPR